MIFNITPRDDIYVSRSDVNDPLAAWSKYDFELDEANWPSVEHYYQAMKFEEPEIREMIRNAVHPKDAQKLAKKHKRKIRPDWDRIKATVMTRATYIKCRTHEAVASALLETGSKHIVENSQYDYYWGCGRDARGKNTYGKILMDIREKLRQIED